MAKVSDATLLKIKGVTGGEGHAVILQVLNELYELDKEALVRDLNEKTQGKAERCKELIKLFTPRIDD